MSQMIEVEPGVFVPVKCRDEINDPSSPGYVPPCTEPGSLPRCQLCPLSPNYWRRTEHVWVTEVPRL